MKRIRFLILTIFVITILLSGCSKPDAPVITTEQNIVSENDTITLSWETIEDADTYKVFVYIFPKTDERLVKSIELTDLVWEDKLSQGKYDIVVYSMKNEKLGNPSEKITLTVEAESIPSWEEIDLIFTTSNEEMEAMIGQAFAQSSTGSEYIRSYDDPEYDLIYDSKSLTQCVQIDIYDSEYILLGQRIGVNTQAELISALNQNEIESENQTTDTDAGVLVTTTFDYNGYGFIAHIDKTNKISYISIIK